MLPENSDELRLEAENTQIPASPNVDGEQNRHSTPERLGATTPQDEGTHLSGVHAALSPDEEETKYSGQKLDGLGISKQRSKSMKHDEPPTAASYTASGKK